MNLPALQIGHYISRLPIIQGGMGVGISLSGMAAAVGREGGIGVIAAAMAGIDEPDVGRHPEEANRRVLIREIRKARSDNQGILGVNIMGVLTNYADLVATAIREKVDIIFAGAGLPLDLPGYLTRGARTCLVPIVSSARAARLICQKWLSRYDYLPDGFVVEGPQAGGHLGFKTEQIDHPAFRLECLVQEVIDSVKIFEAQKQRAIPVIAAGGVYDGADIHRFLQLGAAGVQMGTRFVATHECDAHISFKEAYINATEADMVIIKSPVGLPGRAVRNAFIDAMNLGAKTPFRCPFHCIKTCDSSKSPYCIAIALANACKGRLKHGFAFAGKNAYRIQEIVSVKALLVSLQREFSLAAGERVSC